MKGPKLWVALTCIGTGVVLGVVSLVVLATAFIDSLSGPRFDVPGSAALDLDSGTWVVYERTGTSTGAGGIDVTNNGFVTIAPGDITVDGPAPVEVSRGSFTSETVTLNSRVYTGVARLEVEQSGRYTMTVAGPGEPSLGGEVLIARPITDVFGKWPFILLLVVGVGLVIVGAVCWIVGGMHRSAAKKAGRAT